MKEKQKSNSHILAQLYTEDELKKLAKEVSDDFERRKMERRPFELTWQLAINFLMGNQFSYITSANEIEDEGKQYFWQEREVFNHIAPIVESRLAKLSQVRPTMTIIPASNDDNDVYSAKLGKSILKAVEHKLGLNEIISSATRWSEICGTSFYKVFWDSTSGAVIAKDENGKEIHEGDVNILAIAPYEIYPDSSACEEVEELRSIIHARCYSKDEIKSTWGVDVNGSDIDVFSIHNTPNLGGLGYQTASMGVSREVRGDSAVVIERYEAPSDKYPNGRLVIVCEDKVLHIDELPFVNLADGKRGFPFIKQTAFARPACFWGSSVIDRCIPIQRAYNAVKNRKHEYLNRLSVGILTVEDGSIDTENLEEEGLSPGKILIYRQGSTPPGIMNPGSIPNDFTTEENYLLNEFNAISGVSDIMRNSGLFATGALSGVALQLLIDQDDSRLKETSDRVKFAIKHIAKHVIRLYKQFATMPRLSHIVGENGSLESFYFSASDISSDDVVFETETEIGESLSQKRNNIYQLLGTGLLQDENGKLSNSTRSKILEMLGFGIWEGVHDLSAIHIRRADEENAKVKKGRNIKVAEIDDHDLHITQHLALALETQSERVRETLTAHIKEHKNYLALTKKAEMLTKGE